MPRRPRRGGVDWSSIVLLLPALVIGIALLASAGRREPFSQRAAGAGTVMVIVAGGLIASELRDGWRRRHEPRQDECDRTDDRWRR